MTDTERTFGVPVLKKSLIGQQLDFDRITWKGVLVETREDDDIPVIERINTELEKNGSHS